MNLATFKNVPVVTLCWVAFFILCFVVFLVLSLCSGKKDLRERRAARRGHSNQRASLQWGMGLEGPEGERPWAGGGGSIRFSRVCPSVVRKLAQQTNGRVELHVPQVGKVLSRRGPRPGRTRGERREGFAVPGAVGQGRRARGRRGRHGAHRPRVPMLTRGAARDAATGSSDQAEFGWEPSVRGFLFVFDLLCRN